MVRKTAALAIASAIISVFPSVVNAQNPCPSLSPPPEGLSQGQIYYFGSNKWNVVSGQEDPHTFPPRQYSFVYVVSVQDRRSGVIVVKSGRYLDAATAQPTNTVLMIRTDSKFTNTRSCPRKSIKGLDSGRDRSFNPRGELVSTTSYDGYHDYGYIGPLSDMDKIDRFHVGYETANNQCSATDDDSSDETFSSGFFRSNRSQFSFDDWFVDHGMGWQLADATASVVGHANAAYGRFAERQVEIKRYEADGQRPACVAFTVTITGSNPFLSVNDLENWQNGIRGRETRWNHAH